MDEKLQEDWLDARLRDEAPYVDDAGFTARVMKQLPAAAPRRSFREIFIICMTLAASAITYFASNGGEFLVTSFRQLAGLPTLWLLALAAICGVICTSIATLAAVSKVREGPR
jgi:hypothetical protein